MRKYIFGTTKGQLIIVWICLMLTIFFIGAMCFLVFEDLALGLFIDFTCLLPLIGFCIWAIVYSQKNYNRTTYALAGHKKKATIVRVRKIGGKTPYTEITYSYKTDMGEEVLGVEGVNYSWYKISKEGMIIHIYVNGEYGCFKKDEFQYDVTHQEEFEYAY